MIRLLSTTETRPFWPPPWPSWLSGLRLSQKTSNWHRVPSLLAQWVPPSRNQRPSIWDKDQIQANLPWAIAAWLDSRSRKRTDCSSWWGPSPFASCMIFQWYSSTVLWSFGSPSTFLISRVLCLIHLTRPSCCGKSSMVPIWTSAESCCSGVGLCWEQRQRSDAVPSSPTGYLEIEKS